MRYHNITKVDMLNGPGIRVVLWVSGCEHQCKHCHNPFTWDPEKGLIFDTKAKIELFEALDKDYITGITFSGGDPLYPNNRTTICSLIEEIREKFGNSKSIWLYTGYLYEDIKFLVRKVDIVVDGEFIYELRDKQYPWAGSTNQRIIDVQKSIKENKVVCLKYENNMFIVKEN